MKTSSRDFSTVDSGLSFENHVAELYESLGYSTERNTLICGRQVDFLAKKLLPGIGPTTLIIECKYRSDANVSSSEVTEFIHFMFHAVTSGAASKGCLVTNRGFSKEASAAALQSSTVSLLTTASLEDQLLDLRDVYNEFISRYAETDIFSEYIPLAATERSENQSHGRQFENIEEEIIELIDSSPVKFFSILADYGAGKTTLLERLKYRYCVSYLRGESNKKPIFIELRNYHRYGEINALVRHATLLEFQREIPLYLFWQEVSNGKFLLLLDGFDEMVAQVDAARRIKNFVEISALVSGRSKALLTCRPSYFVTPEEYHQAISLINREKEALPMLVKKHRRKDRQTRKRDAEELRDHLLQKFHISRTLHGLRSMQMITIQIESLREDHIEQYLSKFDSEFQRKCGCSWREIQRFLERVYDLHDLIKRPILLKMIVETILDGRINLADSSIQIGPSSLYEIYASMHFDLDWEKGESRHFLTKGERFLLSEAIALAVFQSPSLSVSYEELESIIENNSKLLGRIGERLEDLSLEEIATDIQVSTFITWDESGGFRFIHKSFVEFFVARYLKRSLDKGQEDLLLLKHLPREVLYFLGGFTVADPGFEDVLRERLNRAKGMVEQNLARTIFYCGPTIEDLEMRDLAIQEIDIRRLRIIRSNFKKITFSRVQSAAFEIVESNLIECSLERSALADWRLVKTPCSVLVIESEIQKSSFSEAIVKVTGRSAFVRDSKFIDCETFLEGDIAYHGCVFEGGRACLGSAYLDSNVVTFRESIFRNSELSCGNGRSKVSCNVESLTFHNCIMLGIKLSDIGWRRVELKDCKGLIVLLGSSDGGFSNMVLWSIDKDLRDELSGADVVPSELELEFTRHGVSLPFGSHLSCLRRDRLWLAEDGKNGMTYLIECENDKTVVRAGPYSVVDGSTIVVSGQEVFRADVLKSAIERSMSQLFDRRLVRLLREALAGASKENF